MHSCDINDDIVASMRQREVRYNYAWLVDQLQDGNLVGLTLFAKLALRL
jgi:hypothetical protein